MGSGKRVTDQQVKELRRRLEESGSLLQAAMRANMDRKTARKHREGPLPSERHRPRSYRTRIDPLAAVWPELEAHLERDASVSAKTLWEWLQETYPDQDWESKRRTLERRVHGWRGRHGPEQEVYFTQVHEPGRLGASDFTHMSELGVTIQGESFPHLAYHFVLTYSNWEHVTVCSSESFASLSEGLQNALWSLGAVPARHRTDRMTLACHQDGNPEEYTAKYRGLLSHYGVTAERTNPASGHENGDAESSHRHFKATVSNWLKLRGSKDFASVAEYQTFLRENTNRRNGPRRVKLAEELARMRALPARRLESVERERVKVSQGSTIRVKKNTYSVPSRLRGEWVEARIGMDEIEVWYGAQHVQTMSRLRGQDKHRIDYRHVIHSLVRKPGAFARYVYREDMYPSVTYRRAYDRLVSQDAGRADRHYVRILELAAREGESRVEAVLTSLLEASVLFTDQVVRARLGLETGPMQAARLEVPAVDLSAYDALLEASAWNDSRESASAPLEASDQGRSLEEASAGDKPFAVQEEKNDEQGCVEAIVGVSSGVALADDAVAARGGGSSSVGGIVGLCGVLAGIIAAGMSAASPQPHRAFAEGIAVAVGKDVVGAGLEAFAAEGVATTAKFVERRLFGSARERLGVWHAGLGEDARLGGPVAGTGAHELSADLVHELQLAGAGSARGQARPDAEGTAETFVAVGGPGDRRRGLRAAEPGRNGSVVHAVVGALRAWQCAVDEQLAVFEVGADLQGSDDDGGRDRSPSASQRDRGDERVELPSRGGQEGQGKGRTRGQGKRRTRMTGRQTGGEAEPLRGPGYAAGDVAALHLPPLRQAPSTESARNPGGEF